MALWATTLYDEVLELGDTGACQTFTRQLRTRQLRPVCQDCRPAKGRPVAVIEHPPGEETQWDWVELPDPPTSWGWGKNAHLLVGVLAHSGRWRGILLEAEDQAHFVTGIDHILRALGGLTKVWRFDRMATVCPPDLLQLAVPAPARWRPDISALTTHPRVATVLNHGSLSLNVASQEVR